MMSNDLRTKIRNMAAGPCLAGFATVRPDGKPWVRYVMVITDEDLSRIRFATHSDSRKIEDIDRNPEVHLTLGGDDADAMGPYLQVEGTAEFTQDEDARREFWQEGFEPYFEGADDPRYGVVVIRPYRFELWRPPNRTPEVLEV